MRSACSWTMDFFMYHVPMYRVPCIKFARCRAKRKQGEFLNQRGFCGRKGFEMDRWTFSCTMYRCTMYHVFDNVRVAHVFSDRMMNIAGVFLGVRVMRSASTRSCSFISEVFFL